MPTVPNHTVCGTCGSIDCTLRADKAKGIAGVCKWSPEFGNHPSLPPAGQFVGSKTQKELKDRGFRNLVWGKLADGTLWEVPKASNDGMTAYKKLLNEVRASKASALGPKTGPTRADQTTETALRCTKHAR